MRWTCSAKSARRRRTSRAAARLSIRCSLCHAPEVEAGRRTGLVLPEPDLQLTKSDSPGGQAHDTAQAQPARVGRVVVVGHHRCRLRRRHADVGGGNHRILRPTCQLPKHSLIPTINVVKAAPWPDGTKPRRRRPCKSRPLPAASIIRAGSTSLPNGDVLVAETNAPPRPEDGKGIKGWFIKQFHEEGGRRRCRARTASRCCATPTATASPRRARRSSTGLNSPFGMALVGDDLYVANTDAVVRFPYTTGATQITARRHEGRRPAGRPAQPSLDEERDREPRRLEALRRPSARTATSPRTAWRRRRAARRSGRSTRATGAHRVFASGPAQSRTAWRGSRETGALWTAVNERDELGSDLVPDYMTSVQDGGFYGWPYSYFGQHVDDAREAAAARPGREGDRARLRARPAHRVARPRASATATRCRRAFASGMFVGQHGSWNRKPRSGYKVIFVPFASGRPAGDAGRRADRLRRARTATPRAPGRRRDRQARRAAGRRRRRQRDLARDRLATARPVTDAWKAAGIQGACIWQSSGAIR